jgi:hypothetical protein
MCPLQRGRPLGHRQQPLGVLLTVGEEMHWYNWGVCSSSSWPTDVHSALLVCLAPSCEVAALCAMCHVLCAVCLRSGPAGWFLEREGSCGCIGDALDHQPTGHASRL